MRLRVSGGGLHAIGVAAIVFDAILALARPAAAQSEQEDLGAQSEALDAKETLYLQQHPVRPSLLFDSVLGLVETLGEFDARAIDACDYVQDFRDWQAMLPKLRENTIVAFSAGFRRGVEKVLATPSSETVTYRSLCADIKRNYNKTLRDIAEAAPALRKAGY